MQSQSSQSMVKMNGAYAPPLTCAPAFVRALNAHAKSGCHTFMRQPQWLILE